MDIKQLLNTSEQAGAQPSQQEQRPVLPNPFRQSTSPEMPNYLAPPIATVNAPYRPTYATTEPVRYRTGSVSVPPSVETSPALSSSSIMTPPSPNSFRSSPPVPLSPNDRQDRSPTDSGNGGRDANGRERRDFRPTYQEEEEFFIWYHRDDLSLDWTEVRNAYNEQFPARKRKGFQGIQCKYYRCCSSHGVPSVRERAKRNANGERRKWGVRQVMPHLWYPWMKQELETPSRR